MRVSRYTVGLLLFCLLGCDSTTRESEPAGLPELNPGTLATLMEQQLTGYAVAEAAGYPQDYQPHATAPVESWQILALLQTTDGGHLAVQHTLDRLAVQPADFVATDSAWGFRDLVRASLAITDQTTGEFDQTENVQRAAMGLAGSDDNSLWSSMHRIQINPGEDCGAVALSISTLMRLTAAMVSCPQALELGSVVVVSSASLEITGERTGSDTPYKGVGWLRQSWGQPPSEPAAVLVDRATIVLERQGVLEVTRSKRRSGRGVPVVSARWLSDDRRNSASASDRAEMNAALINADIDWLDGPANKNGGDDVEAAIQYPSEWTLRIDQMGIEINLVPWHSQQVLQHPSGERWSGAVTVTGSHSGQAIVEFSPVPVVDGLL